MHRIALILTMLLFGGFLAANSMAESMVIGEASIVIPAPTGLSSPSPYDSPGLISELNRYVQPPSRLLFSFFSPSTIEAARKDNRHGFNHYWGMVTTRMQANERRVVTPEVFLQLEGRMAQRFASSPKQNVLRNENSYSPVKKSGVVLGDYTKPHIVSRSSNYITIGSIITVNQAGMYNAPAYIYSTITMLLVKGKVLELNMYGPTSKKFPSGKTIDQTDNALAQWIMEITEANQ